MRIERLISERTWIPGYVTDWNKMHKKRFSGALRSAYFVDTDESVRIVNETTGTWVF